MRLSVVIAAALAACAPVGDRAPEVAAEPSTVVYQCDGMQVMAAFNGPAATLWLPDGTHLLTATPAASGVRYEGDGLLFWTKGQTSALLDRPGEVSVVCEPGPPPSWRGVVEAGATFRAIGQEPGWLLDLYPDGRLHLRADYGTLQVYAPVPEPRVEGDTMTYETRTDSNAPLRVEIIDQPCRDGMSGHPFPKTVRVTLDGTSWQGCGMALAGR